MTCKCIEVVNDRLTAENTQLHTPFFGLQRPFVETIKLDEKKRGKPVKMFPTYCPFCGAAYEAAP